MTREEAIDLINRYLDISADVTVSSTELKCWTPDTKEGGLIKTYVSAESCFELSRAFATVGDSLAKRRP